MSITIVEAYSHHPPPRANLEAALASDLRLFLSHGLNRLDKNLMQHAVEYREPFLDRSLGRLVLNLPLEYRISPTLKGVLADIASSYLPHHLVVRRKVGFSFDPVLAMLPIRNDFLSRGELRNIMEKSVASWEALLSELRGRDLFRLLSAEVWVRLFILQDDPILVEQALWACS
jgi:asparagine synthase (glutamine-hydrolysing)